MDSQKPTVSVKLVLLGEAAVGKSSLVLRFVSDEFQENKEPTIGAAFLTQKCILPNRTIKFEIWDTAGQERFASLAPMYYRNAQSALVVYDVTKPTSFIKARHWVNELKAQANPGIVIALVGNKTDLTANEEQLDGTLDGEEHRVPSSEGQKLAEDEGLLFFETSAKSGVNVRETFLAIAGAIPEETGRKSNSGSVAHEQSDGRVDLNSSHAREQQSQNCAC